MPQSTTSIFRHLYQKLPPLYPKEKKEEMQNALEQLENNKDINREQAEDTAIAFGYEVWPYNQAFKEFLAINEGKIGNDFLFPLLSLDLREKYEDFIEMGGSLKELHSGRPAEFFESVERVELCEALVEMEKKIREFTVNQIILKFKNKYLERVGEFVEILNKVRQEFKILETLAEEEQDHPVLVQEIKSKIRGFEQGLCLLGPELDFNAVCQTNEFFIDRQTHLNNLKGIHLVEEIEIY